MQKLNKQVLSRYFDDRVVMFRYSSVSEDRGSLFPFEFDQFPFSPMRFYVVNSVPTGVTRGGHGHRSCRQLLFCISGKIDVLVRYGGNKAVVRLERPDDALYLQNGVWASQTYLSPDSTLLVFASEAYDPTSYFCEPEGG